MRPQHLYVLWHHLFQRTAGQVQAKKDKTKAPFGGQVLYPNHVLTNLKIEMKTTKTTEGYHATRRFHPRRPHCCTVPRSCL